MSREHDTVGLIRTLASTREEQAFMEKNWGVIAFYIREALEAEFERGFQEGQENYAQDSKPGLRREMKEPNWRLREDEEGQFIANANGDEDAMFPVYLSEEPELRKKEIQLILSALNNPRAIGGRR